MAVGGGGGRAMAPPQLELNIYIYISGNFHTARESPHDAALLLLVLLERNVALSRRTQGAMRAIRRHALGFCWLL